jgi:hypothetical protein
MSQAAAGAHGAGIDPSGGARCSATASLRASRDPYAGRVLEFGSGKEGVKIKLRLRDGFHVESLRGHVDSDKSSKVGLPYAFDHIFSMAAWMAEVPHRSDHDGFIRYSKTSYKPPSKGDVTARNLRVSGRQEKSVWEGSLARLAAMMNRRCRAHRRGRSTQSPRVDPPGFSNRGH